MQENQGQANDLGTLSAQICRLKGGQEVKKDGKKNGTKSRDEFENMWKDVRVGTRVKRTEHTGRGRAAGRGSGRKDQLRSADS